MEKVIVSVEKYKSNDGRVFDKEADCIHHELMASGVRRICAWCHGDKKVPDAGNCYYIKCDGCDGKGWQEKYETPNWR